MRRLHIARTITKHLKLMMYLYNISNRFGTSVRQLVLVAFEQLQDAEVAISDANNDDRKRQSGRVYDRLRRFFHICQLSVCQYDKYFVPRAVFVYMSLPELARSLTLKNKLTDEVYDLYLRCNLANDRSQVGRLV